MPTKSKFKPRHAKKSKKKQAKPQDMGVYVWSPSGVKPLKVSAISVDVVPPPHGSGMGLKFKDSDGLIRALKRGLPISAFDHLQTAIDVSAADLAGAVNIATRTLSRRRTEGRFQTDESERLFRIAALFDRAVEVLGDGERASTWFKGPKKALGGQTPLEYADTEPGAREVENLLGRLEYGVFS